MRIITSTTLLCIQAFNTIIKSPVPSPKDRLHFLNRYTTGKANDVIKGFIALNSDNGYKEARKLHAQRFGDPHHVSDTHKTKPREWPQIKEEQACKNFQNSWAIAKKP